MKRRDFVRLGLVSGAAVAATSSNAALAAAGSVASSDGSLSHDLNEATVTQLQAAMASGKLTARALASHYLKRIEAIDKSGPHLNSIIEINPDVLKIADELDRERREKGPRGPLHGIPVLIKDNIVTADRMHTTAGSLALVDVKPPHDSHVAAQLRAAGALILGKTNLSEWANLRSTRSTSGWSGRGGLTRNPYALDRNCSGSSSGSGAAIAANLAAIAVGTETDGSIVSPASICGLVGIKPTLGVISRNGIIPIAHSQDTAGPMARTVTDAAILLNALAGADDRDPITKESVGKVPDFLKFLDKGGLKGARIGVARNFFGNNDEVDALIEQALQVLKAQGAILIDPVEIPNVAKYGDSELEVLLYEFKADLQAYLAEFAPGASIATMADVIAFNTKNAGRELQFFGQELLQRSNAKGGLDSKEYLDALANNHRYAREEGIDQVMKEHQLDALVAPTGGPAWLNDFINGDHTGNGFSTPAAVAGYPHITVPAGMLHGLPIGLSFVGTAYTESTLIRLAYAYEQATRLRQVPRYPRSVNLPA
ncbi:MAG TPA: amidase [Burkholderiaceae bacterium]|jgi:amidase|nr:amidase [Burkholderiaceae bacterium]